MEIKVNILDTDVCYHITSEQKCSRCRQDFREDEVPLRLWTEHDANYMWAYCEACSNEVISG